MKRALAGALVALCALSASGCSTFFGPVWKDDYWKEIHDQSDSDEQARLKNDPAASFFLGIRTQAHETTFQIGIPIERVYAEGPAARAGLRRYDEIRSIDGVPVRTPGDARQVLTRLFKEETPRMNAQREIDAREKPDKVSPPRRPTQIVYAREGREIPVTLDLMTREGYLDVRRKGVLDRSRYDESGANGWGFWKTRTLAPEFVDDYFGVSIPNEVRVAQDLDILPLVFGISLLRIEKVPVADATRVTFLTSLIQFSSRGDDVARSLEGLIPDPPQDTTDL